MATSVMAIKTISTTMPKMGIQSTIRFPPLPVLRLHLLDDEGAALDARDLDAVPGLQVLCGDRGKERAATGVRGELHLAADPGMEGYGDLAASANEGREPVLGRRLALREHH